MKPTKKQKEAKRAAEKKRTREIYVEESKKIKTKPTDKNHKAATARRLGVASNRVHMEIIEPKQRANNKRNAKLGINGYKKKPKK